MGAVGIGIYLTQTDPSYIGIFITRSHFLNNKDLRGQPVVVDVSNAWAIEICDSEFLHNRGTAVRATTLLVGNNINRLKLNGDVVFRNNSGLQGGAIALVSFQIIFESGANIIFENNAAEDVGGAIYVENTVLTLYDVNNPSTNNTCFYSLDEVLGSQYNISFVNNSAKNGGDHIYGTSMMSYCIASFNITLAKRSVDPDIQQFFSFSN